MLDLYVSEERRIQVQMPMMETIRFSFSRQTIDMCGMEIPYRSLVFERETVFFLFGICFLDSNVQMQDLYFTKKLLCEF